MKPSHVVALSICSLTLLLATPLHAAARVRASHPSGATSSRGLGAGGISHPAGPVNKTGTRVRSKRRASPARASNPRSAKRVATRKSSARAAAPKTSWGYELKATAFATSFLLGFATTAASVLIVLGPSGGDHVYLSMATMSIGTAVAALSAKFMPKPPKAAPSPK